MLPGLYSLAVSAGEGESVEAAPGPVDSDAVARARELVHRFLDDRPERTARAYSGDLDEFARFADREPAVAIAELLAAGPSGGRRLALEYAVALRRQGRAAATVDRRLSTLRAVVRMAMEEGLAAWVLELPSQDQVTAATGGSAAVDAAPYLFPRHPSEVDRLDVQHYALRETLGANYLAPIDRPARVLDTGSGSGQWGFELSGQFPEALVVGLDLGAGKREQQPPGHRFVRGNLLQGLPFRDDQFDFVHQRLLLAGVPLASWPQVVGELVRVTRPGGWVELVEPPFEIEREGPANQRLRTFTIALAASRGMDSGRVVFDSVDGWLRRAGLVKVVRREIGVRIGEWGGQAGSLMVSDFRAAYTRLLDAMEQRSMLTVEEGRDLVQRAQQEWEHNRMLWSFAIAFGQKP
jgi:SAM-dependent methyltransferase